MFHNRNVYYLNVADVRSERDTAFVPVCAVEHELVTPEVRSVSEAHFIKGKKETVENVCTVRALPLSPSDL